MNTFFHFYIWRSRLIIPTSARTGEGFYLDVEPVVIVSLDDVQAMKDALLEAVSQDNPLVVTPDPAALPGSVVLEKLDLRRWADFEREATLYTIHRAENSINVHVTGRGKDGMWRQAAENMMTFPPDTPLAGLVAVVAGDVLARREALARQQQVPLLGPPRKKD